MAIAIVGLAAHLSASTANLRKGLNDSRRLWRSHNADLRRGLTTIRNSAAIATAGLTASFAVATRSVLRSADEIAKASRDAGLSASAYQRLGTVFELSGSNAGQLTRAVQNAQRAVVEAASGTRTYADALEATGISVDQLQGLAPEDLFRRLLQGVADIADPALRTTTAMELFGRAGRELGTVLETIQGGGLAGLEARVEGLGTVMGEDLLNNVEQVNDNFALFGKALRAQFGQGITTALGGLTEMDGVIRGVSEAVGTITESIVGSVAHLGTFVSENVAVIRGVFRVVSDAIQAAVGFLAEHANTLARIAVVYGAVRAVLFGASVLQAVAGAVLALRTLATTYLAVGAAGLRAAAGQAAAAAYPIAIGAAVVALAGLITGLVRAGFAAWRGLSDAFRGIGQTIGAEVSLIGVAFQHMWATLRLAAVVALRAVLQLVNRVIGGIVDRVNALGGFFNRALSFLGIEHRFGTIASIEVDTSGLDRSAENLRGRLDELRGEEGRLLQAHADGRQAVAQGLVDAAKSAGQSLVSDGKAVADAFVSGGKQFVELLRDPLGTLQSSLAGAGADDFVGPRRPGGQAAVAAAQVVAPFRLPTPVAAPGSPEFVGPVRPSAGAGAASDTEQSVAEQYSERVSRSLAEAISSGDFSSVGEALTGSLRSVFQDAVSNRLTEFLSSLLDNLFSSLFAGSGGGGGGFGALFGGIFHEGGIVPGPRGAERLILAQAGERVLTPAQQAGLGQQVSINYNLTGDVSDATLRAMRQHGRELSGIVRRQFAEERLL